MSFKRTLLALLVSGCASPSTDALRMPVAHAARPSDDDRAHTMAFVRIEDEVIDWLAAADPRLAIRADATAPDTVLKRVGLEGVLAEDTAAQIRGSSLDLFAF